MHQVLNAMTRTTTQKEDDLIEASKQVRRLKMALALLTNVDLDNKTNQYKVEGSSDLEPARKLINVALSKYQKARQQAARALLAERYGDTP